MFCSQCGAALPADSRLCPSCGSPAAQQDAVRSDSDLEALAAAGDREAFADLYERHVDRVYDFLRRMVRDPDEAADLAQETFLRAMRALSPKEKKAAFSTWLFTIARNLAIKRLERQRRIATTAEREAEEEEPVLYRRVDPDRFADPQAALEAQELSGLVWQAAGALSPKEYSLLDLHVRQGLDSAEIGHMLGVSKGNAYTMISRLKDSFESAVAALQLLQRGRKECPELSRLLEEHRITFISPQARRLIDRHVAQCPTCQEQRRRLVSPTVIFGSFAAVPVPFGLKPRLAEALMGSWAEAGTEAAAPGLGSRLSPSTAKLRSLPLGWKAVLIGGLLIAAIGGGLGGWVGVGGGFLGIGNGDRGGPTGAVPTTSVPNPNPTPSPTVEPVSTAEPTGLAELAYLDGGDIWVVAADRSGQRRITQQGDIGPDSRATWSPTGERLAYTAAGALWIADVEETSSVRVDDTVDSFSWLGDGEALAYVARGAAYLDRLDDPDNPQIVGTLGADGPLGLTSWSPDGRYLAFGPQVHLDGTDYRAPLLLLDLQSGESRLIAEDGPLTSGWSPDSRLLAYWTRVSFGASDFGGEVVIFDVESGATVSLGSYHSDFPGQWAPDSARYVFDRWLIDVSAHTVSPLFSLDEPALLYWAPDGRRVAAADGWADEIRDLRVTDVDTGRFRTVYTAKGSLIHAAEPGYSVWWHPDGSRLAFTVTEPTSSDPSAVKISLYVADLTTGELQQLVGPARGALSYDPTGSKLAVQDWDQGAIWVAEKDGSRLRQLVDGSFLGWRPSAPGTWARAW